MSDKDLDQLLDELADDVPEMPADFHARWTAAVAAEAERGDEGESVDENDEKRNGRTVPLFRFGPKTKRGDRPSVSIHWRRLIGVAAVMVFLVGGTLLTRDSFHARMSMPVLESRREDGASDSAAMTVEWETTAALTPVPTATPEMEGALSAQGLMMTNAPTAGPTAIPEMTATAVAAATAWPTESYRGEDLSDVVEEEVELEESFDGGMALAAGQVALESAEVMDDEAADESVREDHAANAMEPEEVPTPEKMEAVGARRMISSVRATESPRSPLVDFLKDMGQFMLFIAPWALVLAAGVLAGWFFTRKK